MGPNEEGMRRCIACRIDCRALPSQRKDDQQGRIRDLWRSLPKEVDFRTMESKLHVGCISRASAST